MTTLYLHVPQEKADTEGKKSYEDTLKTAIGSGYAIPKGDAAQCSSGCDVVLLCQGTKQRTQGKLKALENTGERTKTGMIRYDVHLNDIVEVPYSPPPAHFRHTGILVMR